MNSKLVERINNLKLLEQFYTVLGRDMYKDSDHAHTFCELLKDMIHEHRPTKERAELANSLPSLGTHHFNNELLLASIADKITAIAALNSTDEAFARDLRALLK